MENPSFRTGGLRGHRHPRPRKTRRSQGTRQRRPAEEQGARPGLRGVRWEVRGLDGAGPTGPRTGGGVSARRPRPLRHSRLGGSLPRACSHGVRTGSPGRTAGSPGGFSAARTVGSAQAPHLRGRGAPRSAEPERGGHPCVSVLAELKGRLRGRGGAWNRGTGRGRGGGVRTEAPPSSVPGRRPQTRRPGTAAGPAPAGSARSRAPPGAHARNGHPARRFRVRVE